MGPTTKLADACRRLASRPSPLSCLSSLFVFCALSLPALLRGRLAPSGGAIGVVFFCGPRFAPPLCSPHQHIVLLSLFSQQLVCTHAQGSRSGSLPFFV